jgi:hypothetical protein
MYLLVCSITSIESLTGLRVFFGAVDARGVFSLINETFSLSASESFGFVGALGVCCIMNKRTLLSFNNLRDGASAPPPALPRAQSPALWMRICLWKHAAGSPGGTPGDPCVITTMTLRTDSPNVRPSLRAPTTTATGAPSTTTSYRRREQRVDP